MARKNHRVERPVDRYSNVALYSVYNENNRDARTSRPIISQEVRDSPPVTRERRYEKLRKLGAISFSSTLDPAEAEAWLEGTERIFNLMQCA